MKWTEFLNELQAHDFVLSSIINWIYIGNKTTISNIMSIITLQHQFLGEYINQSN